MLYTCNPTIKHKVGLFNLAEEFGNVLKPYEVMCIYYRTAIAPLPTPS